MSGTGWLAALVFALVVPACAASGPAAARRLSCELKMTGSPTVGGPAVAQLTLANPGASPLFALRWGTPFEAGWLGTPFTLVGPDGAEVPFGGAEAKRGDPGREAYVEVPAGGEVSARADLAAAYQLAVPGTYELRTSRDLYDLGTAAADVPRPRSRHQAAPLGCAPLRFTVAPR